MLRKDVCLFSLLLSHLFLSCYGECVVVDDCSDDQSPLAIGGLVYKLNTASWDSDKSIVCPRNDVPYWYLSFEDSAENELTTGTFCTEATALKLFDVCKMNGGLVFFKKADSQNKTGSFTFGFNNASYNTNVTIRYANSTGVYPEKDVVYFEPFITDLVPLNYFIYSSDSDPITYFNSLILTNNTVSSNSDLYGTYQNPTKCFSSTSSESTTLFQLYLFNPTVSAAGEYILKVGAFSATVTLALKLSPSSSSTVVSSEYTFLSTSITQAADKAFSPSSDVLHSSPSTTYNGSAVLFSPNATLLTMLPTTYQSSPSLVASEDLSMIENNNLPIFLLVPLLLVVVLLLLIILVVVMITGILKIVSMKRKKDVTDEDLESKPVKGTTGDFESKTDEKTLEYAKQYNKDHQPSQNKSSVVRKRTDTEADMEMVDSVYIMEQPVGASQETSLESQSISSSNSSVSMTDMGAVAENTPKYTNPHAAILQKTDNGYSLSLPCTPKLAEGKHREDEFAPSLSSTQLEIHVSREQNHLLKKIYREIKRGNKIGEKVAQNTHQNNDLQEEQVETLQNLSATVERTFVTTSSDSEYCMEEHDERMAEKFHQFKLVQLNQDVTTAINIERAAGERSKSIEHNPHVLDATQ